MKVCILAPENSPSWGGVGAYVYNLAKNLPTDYEIHIITINRNVFDSYDKILQDDRYHFHNILDVSKNDTFFYNFKFQLALLKKLKHIHKKFNFDVIHSHSGHLPHLFSQFQTVAPLVVTVHSTVKGMNANLKHIQSKKSPTEFYMNTFSRFIQIGELLNFKKADKLLPISNYTLSEIINLYRINIQKKSHVLLNATDTDLFKPRETHTCDDNTITFIGRFYAIKGFDIFFKALLNLSKKGYKIKPHLVGRNNNKLFKSQIKSIFPNHVLQELTAYHEMPSIYNNSNIVVVPSRYENCPGVVLEAMSSGKIVVASDVGSISEIIQHGKNGLLFEKENISDLENKIKSILEKTYDLDKMRKNARETIIRNFQWNDRAKKISQIYENLIK